MNTKRQPTRDDQYRLKRKILSYIRKHPSSTRVQIAIGLGFNVNSSEARRVENAIIAMRDRGYINELGNGRGLRYRNTLGAFLMLDVEYKRPQGAAVPASHLLKKITGTTSAQTDNSVNEVNTNEDDEVVGISAKVVPASIKVVIAGYEFQMSVNQAKELHTRLSQALDQ